MNNKSYVHMVLALAAIIGALVIIPAFAQTVEPELETEWTPPCGYWDGEAWNFEEGQEPWWYQEGAEPPCYDPETGEYTPLNPNGYRGGNCFGNDGEAPYNGRGGCGAGRCGGARRGTA